MTLMFTLAHEFELSTIPSIPPNGYVGGLAESVKIFIQPCTGFPPADIFPQQQTSWMHSKRYHKVI